MIGNDIWEEPRGDCGRQYLERDETSPIPCPSCGDVFHSAKSNHGAHDGLRERWREECRRLARERCNRASYVDGVETEEKRSLRHFCFSPFICCAGAHAERWEGLYFYERSPSYSDVSPVGPNIYLINEKKRKKTVKSFYSIHEEQQWGWHMVGSISCWVGFCPLLWIFDGKKLSPNNSTV